MARKSAESGPQMSAPVVPQPPVRRGQKAAWCTFNTRGRCYIEGAILEDAGQTIKLPPAGAYRQRNNKLLELVDGEVPQLPEDAPKDNTSVLFKKYEAEFIADLEDGDPIVGAAPAGLRLIKQ